MCRESNQHCDRRADVDLPIFEEKRLVAAAWCVATVVVESPQKPANVGRLKKAHQDLEHVVDACVLPGINVGHTLDVNMIGASDHEVAIDERFACACDHALAT